MADADADAGSLADAFSESGPVSGRLAGGAARPAPPERIRLLVVEDDRMFAEALAAILASQPGIDVIGSTGSAAGAVAEARRLRPTVVLMDYRLPDGDGTAAARAIRAERPATRVLILTASAEESLLREVMRAGCSGIVTKARSLPDLVRAVRAAAAGETVIAPGVLARVMSAGQSENPGLLSDRELEVLRLIADGLDTREVAGRLDLSVYTVRNHLQRCLRKLGVHSKTQAVAAAMRRGIIPGPG